MLKFIYGKGTMEMLDRDIYNLLGLSFDAVSMETTVQKVIDAISDNHKLFISTPNLNFLIASQHSDEFRKSVLNSDLSIADGMPIVFLCKLLNIPINERVAGSSLIDELRNNEHCKKNPIKVFFFGGQEGIGEKAHEILNKEKGGLKSVGYLNPGFGTVEDMSSQAIIKQINDASPEFIIVSLGAKKGQAWIENNRNSLNANVISHLGAVVNFIAGNVRRAPLWVQKLHMEWIWRIKEEPSLFKRYWKDGIAFLKLIVTKIRPYKRLIDRHKVHSSPNIKPDYERQIVILKGDLTIAVREQLRESFAKFIKDDQTLTLEMSGVTYVDQAILGLILNASAQLEKIDRRLLIGELSIEATKIFKLNNLDYLARIQ